MNLLSSVAMVKLLDWQCLPYRLQMISYAACDRHFDINESGQHLALNHSHNFY